MVAFFDVLTIILTFVAALLWFNASRGRYRRVSMNRSQIRNQRVPPRASRQ
jgi:hypothetical protein